MMLEIQMTLCMTEPDVFRKNSFEINARIKIWPKMNFWNLFKKLVSKFY